MCPILARLSRPSLFDLLCVKTVVHLTIYVKTIVDLKYLCKNHSAFAEYCKSVACPSYHCIMHCPCLHWSLPWHYLHLLTATYLPARWSSGMMNTLSATVVLNLHRSSRPPCLPLLCAVVLNLHRCLPLHRPSRSRPTCACMCCSVPTAASLHLGQD